jgi:hypothetical protein
MEDKPTEVHIMRTETKTKPREPRNARISRAFARVAFIALFAPGLLAGSAAAQNDPRNAQVRDRERLQTPAQEAQGDVLRERIRDRIEREEGLQARERDQLRQHLSECDKLGLGDPVVGALFDETRPLGAQIRTQARVLAIAREGLPVEPVTEKLQEGRRKGVSESVLERACERMEENVRAAGRFMKRAREAGVAPGDDDAEKRRTGEMAKCMWHGLTEGDGDQLRERARLRLRDGSCTTEDLTAAAETAVKLQSFGVESERAKRVAGEALQYGYSAREMRQISWIVMTANAHGGPRDQVLGHLEKGIRSHHQLSQMAREMWQRGWMGPGDEHRGLGGHNMMDDAGGSGAHHGGHDDDDGHGDGHGGQQGGGEQGGGTGSGRGHG